MTGIAELIRSIANNMKLIIIAAAFFVILVILMMIMTECVYGADDDCTVKEQTASFVPWCTEEICHTDVTINWGWDYFLTGDSYEYNNELAISCMAMSAACNYSQEDIETLLRQLGFDEVRSYNYTKEWYKISYPAVCFGHKKIIKNGEIYNIFAIVIRGTSGTADVLTDILSFAGAFENANTNIKRQFRSFVIDVTGSGWSKLNRNNTRILLTGHSLGGAVSNNLAADLSKAATDRDVYAYTFGTPNCRFIRKTRSSNIRNIINIDDVVVAAMTTMITRNGVNITFRRSDNPRISEGFKYLTQGTDIDDYLKFKVFGGPNIYDKIMCNHSPELYMSYLMSRRNSRKKVNNYY